MATYYLRDCGHRTERDAWKTGSDERLDGLCLNCRAARVGEVIEFARYGKPPAGGQSTNHRERMAEAGISVYEVVNGEIKFTGWHFGITESRPAYSGKGRIIGFGSDGEPLVQILSIRRRREFDQK